MFESRFRDSGSVEFPLRQYLRCREDLTSNLVHMLLLIVFVVTLIAFGRTLNGMFIAHGQELEPWYRWVALSLLAIFSLSILRRLYYKFQDTRELHKCMKELKKQFRS